MSIARSEYTYCAPTIPTKLRVVRDGDAVRTAAPGELPAVVGAGLRVPTLTGEVEYANLDHAGEAALLRAILRAKQAGVIVVVTTHRAALMHAMDHVLTLGDSPAMASGSGLASGGGRGVRTEPAGSLMAAAATRS